MISDPHEPRVPASALVQAAVVLSILVASLPLTVACEKVPLTAPSTATITLYANTPIVPLNGTAEITATVIQTGGTSVHNGTVVSFTASLGTVDPPEATTKNGKVTVLFRAGTQSGTAIVNAYSGAASTSSSGSATAGTGATAGGGVTLLVGAAAVSSVVVTAQPATVPATGGTATVTAAVLDANNNTLPGLPVSFSTDFGSLSSSTATTDQNGKATVSLTTYQTSVVTVTAGPKVTGTATITALALPTVNVSSSTTTPTAGQTTTFTVTIAAGSSGAPITKATINFGDGSSTFNLGAASGSVTVPHIYEEDGTYTVTASATDASGQTTSMSVPITVYPAVPFTLTVTASSGRVGTPITMTAIPGTGSPSIVSYEWNFGDGSAAVVTTTGTVSHIYTSIPTGYTSYPYVITVTARGSDGRTGIGSTSTTITP